MGSTALYTLQVDYEVRAIRPGGSSSPRTSSPTVGTTLTDVVIARTLDADQEYLQTQIETFTPAGSFSEGSFLLARS